MTGRDRTSRAACAVLVEAEQFHDFGGWVLDSQFVDQMGSPYLLAHGLGRPVANARTKVHIPETCEYRIWVRAKDWVPSHHPGRFDVLIDGRRLDIELGANGRDWSWERAGERRIAEGEITLELRDLTGFDGRCDAIYLTTSDAAPVEGAGDAVGAWRRGLLGLPERPVEAGEFDLVVVGGGVGGCAAGLSAARLGCRVALIHNRPCLGGNASSEIGIGPRGEKGPIIEELTDRLEDGVLMALTVLEAEANVALCLEHHVSGVVMDGDRILAVDALNVRSGVERRFRATVFADCSGMAALGLLAGAETRFGREARSEFDESLAPETADLMHHGNTVMFRTCLYSRNVSNLLMAGKHISVTHVAGSSTKMIGNGGQHGIAVGAAAALCRKHGTTPRGVLERHLEELRQVIGSLQHR